MKRHYLIGSTLGMIAVLGGSLIAWNRGEAQSTNGFGSPDPPVVVPLTGGGRDRQTFVVSTPGRWQVYEIVDEPRGSYVRPIPTRRPTTREELPEEVVRPRPDEEGNAQDDDIIREGEDIQDTRGR